MSASADIKPSPPEQISFNAWKTILILSGTIVIFLYLNTAMSPSLPSISAHFQISDTLSSWVMTAYMICGAVMTVIMGRLSDLLGAKKMLMVMMLCFTVGTLLAPYSPNIAVLLALRVLQGIAVASTPISTKLIRDQVPRSKFPIGLSIYMAAYSGGMALGAVLGPVVAAGPGWQGNFYLVAPIAVILLFVCWKFIHADESKKIHEHDYVDKAEAERSVKAQKKDKKPRMDFLGIITVTGTLVSFLVAITFSGSLATDLTKFLIPLIIGIIALVLFIIVEKRVESPLINLKLAFHPVLLIANIMMLMFGILQYFVITGIPQLGSAPPPSGLGLDPIHTGLLQLAFGLALMIFGPIFGIMVAKRAGLNLKLLVPGIAVTAFSFILLLFFHSTTTGINVSLFIFGAAGALIPNTLINNNMSFTPAAYTGVSSALTNMMRIVGGAIGPVLTTVILSSATVSITVNGVEGTYPSPVTFNIVFGLGSAMAVGCLILAFKVKHTSTKLKSLSANNVVSK